MMRGRGASQKLKSWAKKEMGVVRRYGPGIAKQYKLGSRALTSISKANPSYSKYIDPINSIVKQRGYGLRSAGAGCGMCKHGKGLRSAGAGRRRRRH
jgi:hypothetical protein